MIFHDFSLNHSYGETKGGLRSSFDAVSHKTQGESAAFKFSLQNWTNSINFELHIQLLRLPNLKDKERGKSEKETKNTKRKKSLSGIILQIDEQTEKKLEFTGFLQLP